MLDKATTFFMHMCYISIRLKFRSVCRVSCNLWTSHLIKLQFVLSFKGSMTIKLQSQNEVMITKCHFNAFLITSKTELTQSEFWESKTMLAWCFTGVILCRLGRRCSSRVQGCWAVHLHGGSHTSLTVALDYLNCSLLSNWVFICIVFSYSGYRSIPINRG